MRFFLALLLLPFLAAPAFAQEGPDCDDGFAPFVNVTPVFDAARYDFSTSLDGIQQIARDTGHSIHESITLGITRYQAVLEFRTPVVTITSSDGRICTRVQRADVTIGYRDVTVYVAREIPRDSCGFNEVVAHEQKHIEVNREVLQEYAPRIQESIEDYLKSNGVIRGENHDVALAKLRQEMQNLLDDFGTRMMEDNIARQQEIDSPDEYTRLAHVCGGQLASLAARSLGTAR